MLRRYPDARAASACWSITPRNTPSKLILEHGYWAGLTLYPQTKSRRARRRPDREVRPGSDLRRGRVRLGAERPARGAAVRHGDAAPPPSRGADRSGRLREPVAFLSQSPKFVLQPDAVGGRTGALAAGQPMRLASHTPPPPHLLHQHPSRPTAGPRSTRNARALRARAQGALLAGAAVRARPATLGARRPRAARRADLDDFRAFLDDEGLYVAIINGFPYGPFHGTPVKAEVYAPDWRDPAARRLHARPDRASSRRCCPPGVDGGVSTAPLSYKPWMAAADAERWRS